MVADHAFSSSWILVTGGTENPRVGGSIPSQATKLARSPSTCPQLALGPGTERPCPKAEIQGLTFGLRVVYTDVPPRLRDHGVTLSELRSSPGNWVLLVPDAHVT